MILRHTYIIIIISLLLPSIASGQRLASPELTVKEPTFADMSSASVSWNPVANATEYIVTLDKQVVDVIGNTLYLAGKPGRHVVTVVARADGHEDSIASETVIYVRDYGDGSSKKPYLIYDKKDWKQFSEAVTNNHFDNEYFHGYHVALASNINFEGENIRPVGKNLATGFRGVFDGRGYVLKNALMKGKGTLGLFVSLRGVMKNLKADNITISATVTKPSEGRCAVMCGGEATGKFYNCMATNCSVSIGGEGEVGRYAGVIASVLNSPEALLERCISIGNVVSVGNSQASALIARVAAGTVSNCISQNNKVYSGVRLASGIIAQVCGPDAIVSNCRSLSNTITAKAGYATGVASEISSGVVVNCTSDNNVLTVEGGHTVGGVAGMIKGEGNLINCLSKNCVLNINSTKESYAGLLFANADKGLTGAILNCLVLSGSFNISSNLSSYVGIVGGKLADPSRCSECFYNEILIKGSDKSLNRRYAFGASGSGGSDYDSASSVKKSDFESMAAGSIVSRLNTGAYRLTVYGASAWGRDAEGYPSIK